MEKVVSADIGGKELTISTGKIAKQASGSVMVEYGETVVLVTAVAAKDPKADISFLPLSVEYQEKIYAAGRIPGNYFRREIGRPSEHETLNARLIDRPIRPLFEDGYNFETQVVATVMSTDKMCEPGILAMIGASAALEISDIPFSGPIAGIKVGRVNGQFVANPTPEQMEQSDIDLTVAGSKTGVVMVEGGADIVSETDMLDAIFFGHEAMQPAIALQEELKSTVGKAKREFIPPEKDEALAAKVQDWAWDKIHETVQIKTKIERQNALRALKDQAVAEFEPEYSDKVKEIKEVFGNTVKKVSRDIVLKENKRIDGRAFDEIRQITCDVGCLPRPHGSALFTRGETQVIGVLTLGSGLDEQRLETLDSNQETRAFMLHYNFPPYSVGEVRRPGGPSRRDIGHGNLAHRALSPVIPPHDEFEYTIRLVGEVMESNGSSSMGTVCSGCLALMDGGVPIKAPVSGIAMGLVSDENNTVVLSDILGDEDHFGDMDFKVAGTKDGITALQMDIKIKELSKQIMEDALNQANGGRLHILEKMLETLDQSRGDISPHAPKIVSVQINKDKIRDIIGPGGKVIRALQADTNTTIEVNDDGIVKIAAENEDDSAKAVAMVKDIAMDPEIGAIYEGAVVKITDFGAFVNIKSGTDGLVHISELADYRVKKVTDVVKEGEVIKVKVLDITRDGKIKLSYKAAKKMQKTPKNSSFCLCPLASGSKGNAVFVSTADTAVLVDAGLSGIEIQRRMAAIGRTPDDLKAIIITHEHTDHVKGAGVLSRRFNIPLYATADTFKACKGLGKIDQINFFDCGFAFDIGSLAVNPFSISHDACDPAGLTLEHQGKKIGIATDLGVVTNLVRTHLSRANALYIEANHDPDMLMTGPYPWHLKQRIQSRTGHISNQDARDLVAQIRHKDLDHVVLAHLSEENNCPEKAATEMSKNLDPLSTALHVAGPDQPGEMIWL